MRPFLSPSVSLGQNWGSEPKCPEPKSFFQLPPPYCRSVAFPPRPLLSVVLLPGVCPTSSLALPSPLAICLEFTFSSLPFFFVFFGDFVPYCGFSSPIPSRWFSLTPHLASSLLLAFVFIASFFVVHFCCALGTFRAGAPSQPLTGTCFPALCRGGWRGCRLRAPHCLFQFIP